MLTEVGPQGNDPHGHNFYVLQPNEKLTEQKWGTVVHTHNPNTLDTEAGGLL